MTTEAPSPEKEKEKPKTSGGGRRPGNCNIAGGRSAERQTSGHSTPVGRPKFEGKCAALNGNIYDCSDSRQADQFVKTTKEIAEYVGTTYKYGADVRMAVEQLSMPTLELPEDPPANASQTVMKLWEKQTTSNYFERRAETPRRICQTSRVPHGESEDPILPCLGTMYGRYLPEGRGSAGVQGIPPHFRFTRSSPSDSRRHLSLSKYEGPGAISS